MSSRYLAPAVGALLLMAGATFAVATLRQGHQRPMTPPGTTHLVAYGSRGARQPVASGADKFDGTLADLARHAPLAPPDHLLAYLHAVSPAARFKLTADHTPLVLVDAVTQGDPGTLKSVLESLGMQRAALYANDVGGWLPVAQLGAAAARAEVHAIRAALSRTRSGAVTSQGDFAVRADVVRLSDSLTGSGVKVGVLSDSFDCYAVYAAPGSGVPASGAQGYASNGYTATAVTDESTGDLPAGVDVLEEADCANYGYPTRLPLTDEGRAILQVVHDLAPGASLAFYTAENSEADFASGIGALAKAGATVIADDIGYFDEPFFQDGIVAQAIDAVEAQGVAYFSAAGNDADASYENLSPTFATLSASGASAGEYLLNFDTSAATTATALPITVDPLFPGEFIAVVVQWDQPYVTGASGSPGASSRIDLCVAGATSTYIVTDDDGKPETCTGPNAAGADPVQVLIIANPANAGSNTPKETLTLTVGLADATLAPGRVKIAVQTDGQTDAPISAYATHSSTLQGHPGAAGAAAVGAAFFFDTPRCGTSPAALERYSSLGGAPILFSTSGTRLATPIIRQKPDFVGPDGGNDTFLGYPLEDAGYTAANDLLTTSIGECQNVATYPNFFGTSAATPHAASIAALLLQANPGLTPAQLYNALRTSALPMGATTPNLSSGYGFIQADAALALVPPAAPTLSLAPASVTLGGTSTITWSAVNATGCTASGSWSGPLAASGMKTLTPTAAGSETYSLACANAGGTSASSSTTLSVVAAASTGGGGGGALDSLSLLGLVGLALLRGVRRRR